MFSSESVCFCQSASFSRLSQSALLGKSTSHHATFVKHMPSLMKEWSCLEVFVSSTHLEPKRLNAHDPTTLHPETNASNPVGQLESRAGIYDKEMFVFLLVLSYISLSDF